MKSNLKLKYVLGGIILCLSCSIFAQAGKIAIGSGVNSKHDELAPILSPDGQTLYFCREGDPRNAGYKQQSDDQDIWMSQFKDGKWSTAQHITAPFNSKGYDFPIGTSADGKTLYIGNSYGRDGTIGPGVSKTRLVNGKWTFPESLVIKDYYNEANLVNYSMGSDEKTLLLNLQRRDTRGKMDLYVSFREDDGTWTAPLNLGEDINSPAQEVTPFLASDLKTVYFSSNRSGVGGFDMYVSRRLDDTWENWSKPENLGPKINTAGNDISYVIAPNGEFAIFASETKSSGKDLYRIELPKKFRPKKTMLFTGIVIDDQDKPQAAQVVYERLSDGKLLGVAETDAQTGEFKINLPEGEKYSVRAEKNKFLPVRELVDLTQKNNSATKLTLRLTPIKAGSKIRLNSIFFKRRSFELSKASFSELNRLIKVIKENPGMKIEVAGHTDSVGSHKYNQRLSEKRAQSVAAYLVKNGVPKDQIISKGYGETRPVASNKTAAGKQKNRRVEFEIISQKK